MTYDDWKLATPPYYDAPDPDEGLLILQSAMKYLKPRADADIDDTGDYEAYALLDMCCDFVNDEYRCRFCGSMTEKKHSYCSKNCYRADQI